MNFGLNKRDNRILKAIIIISLIIYAIFVLVFMATKISANTILYKDINGKNYAIWAKEEFKTRTPFNETSWKITKYQNKVPKGDVLMEVRYINSWGLGIPCNLTNGGNIVINPYFDGDQRFLLFHELGHAYGMPHFEDGSIMATNGGDAKYRDYQIQIIRNNLNIKQKKMYTNQLNICALLHKRC
jgi:hypothetical protein